MKCFAKMHRGDKDSKGNFFMQTWILDVKAAVVVVNSFRNLPEDNILIFLFQNNAVSLPRLSHLKQDHCQKLRLHQCEFEILSSISVIIS